MAKRKSKSSSKDLAPSNADALSAADYEAVLSSVVGLLASARRNSVRVVNAVMTATYWEIGRRIVEFEQSGDNRAAYGDSLIDRLSVDLTSSVGRGFSARNLRLMRAFYQSWEIRQTLSAKLEGGKSQGQSEPESTASNILQRVSGKSERTDQKSQSQIAAQFPLPWSHYVRLLKVKKDVARQFYETEASRGGGSVRQLDRQISTLFYERTLASRNKSAMLEKGAVPERGEILTAEQEIKDPLVLEFLGLKDEYSESELEAALVEHLETFLLELGGDFTFVGRQRRLRIDDEWYRIDLLFYHRRLRCLVVIDLKLGKFTHADAGQMLLYLGYAAEHWTHEDENPPVGLILCTEHNHAVARYTIDRVPDKVLAAEYRLVLPDEETLAAEIEKTQAMLEQRCELAGGKKTKSQKSKSTSKRGGK